MYRKRHYKANLRIPRGEGARHAPSAGWLFTLENLRRMVAGELSLAITFWWYGLGIPLFIALLVFVLEAWMKPSAALFAGWALAGALAPLQALGVSRAADRYTGPAALATTAQVLAWANVAYLLLIAIAGYVVGDLTQALDWLSGQQPNR